MVFFLHTATPFGAIVALNQMKGRKREMAQIAPVERVHKRLIIKCEIPPPISVVALINTSLYSILLDKYPVLQPSRSDDTHKSLILL